jgi:D-threo-aldose 1-dehydrogenase
VLGSKIEGDEMQRRRFGRTGLEVPAITFGGGWVGGVLIHGGRAEAFAALDLAAEAGIDWIDTAASYGDGVSETVIGAWLADRRPDPAPRISTKFRIDPRAGGWRAQMMRSVDASLRRLGRDRVDLVFLHNQVEPDGGAFPASAALKAADEMEGLREEGACRHLGFTALGDPAGLHRVVREGRFEVAQVYYNAINPTAWIRQEGWSSTNFDGLLHACEGRDMGVMGIRIYAAGYLATTERHGREIPVTANASDAAEEARAAAVLAALGDRHGTPSQTALRFGLACPALSTIVVGIGEIAHLSEAIAAAEAGPLPDEAVAALDEVWKGPAFTHG